MKVRCCRCGDEKKSDRSSGKFAKQGFTALGKGCTQQTNSRTCPVMLLLQGQTNLEKAYLVSGFTAWAPIRNIPPPKGFCSECWRMLADVAATSVEGKVGIRQVERSNLCDLFSMFFVSHIIDITFVFDILVTTYSVSKRSLHSLQIVLSSALLPQSVSPRL